MGYYLLAIPSPEGKSVQIKNMERRREMNKATRDTLVRHLLGDEIKGVFEKAVFKRMLAIMLALAALVLLSLSVNGYTIYLLSQRTPINAIALEKKVMEQMNEKSEEMEKRLAEAETQLANQPEKTIEKVVEKVDETVIAQIHENKNNLVGLEQTSENRFTGFQQQHDQFKEQIFDQLTGLRDNVLRLGQADYLNQQRHELTAARLESSIIVLNMGPVEKWLENEFAVSPSLVPNEWNKIEPNTKITFRYWEKSCEIVVNPGDTIVVELESPNDWQVEVYTFNDRLTKTWIEMDPAFECEIRPEGQ